MITTSDTTHLLASLFAKPRRFLVVDDDAAFVELLKALSRDFNCEFDVALTCDSAIDYCNQIDGYDFVWLDLRLDSGRSGTEVFTRLKSLNRRKPVLIVAGVLTPQDIQSISKVGIAFFLLKPQVFTMECVEEIFSLIGIRRISPLPVDNPPDGGRV